MLKRNKKGSGFFDVLVIIIALLLFSSLTLIFFKVSNDINTKVQASAIFDTKGKTAFNSMNNLYYNSYDNGFLILMVGLSIGALFLATMVRIHPIFFVFFLLLLIVLIVLAAVFSNVYLQMANSSSLSSLADQLTYITWGMWLMPVFVAVIGTIMSIIMYKNYKEGEM